MITRNCKLDTDLATKGISSKNNHLIIRYLQKN